MELRCNACGVKFTAARSDARFCSPRCRTANHRKEHGVIAKPRKRLPLPEALATARNEGNAPRANVSQRMRESGEGRESANPEREAMWEQVDTLAAKGYSSIEVYERIDYGAELRAFQSAARHRGITFTNHKTRLKAIATHTEWFERGLLSIETGLNNIHELVDLKNINDNDKAEALERLNATRNLLASIVRNIKKESVLHAR